MGVVVASTLVDDTFAANKESVRAFHEAILICAGLVAAGGILGAIGGSPNFDDAGFTVNDSKIVYGSTVTAIINFVIVAAVIYFVVVVPMTRLQSRIRGDADVDTPAPSDEAKLLTEIRDLLSRQSP